MVVGRAEPVFHFQTDHITGVPIPGVAVGTHPLSRGRCKLQSEVAERISRKTVARFMIAADWLFYEGTTLIHILPTVFVSNAPLALRKLGCKRDVWASRPTCLLGETCLS